MMSSAVRCIRYRRSWNRCMSRHVDRKMRFAGLLENPLLSRWQRNVLDYGRLQAISRVLGALALRSVLDVGCGLGENSRACACGYVGIDNSAPRVRYAGQNYPGSRFILGDGLGLPVKPRSFDMVMLLDTSHHLNDKQFLSVLAGMAAASRRWVLVSDAVLFRGQSGLSRLIYSCDRGAAFRTGARQTELVCSLPGLVLERMEDFTTFPGFYRRKVLLLKVTG